MRQTLNEIWAFLDGKKTYIGTAFLFAGTFFSEVLISMWHIKYSWAAPMASTLNWIGMAMTGIGVSHKAIKNNNQ